MLSSDFSWVARRPTPKIPPVTAKVTTFGEWSVMRMTVGAPPARSAPPAPAERGQREQSEYQGGVDRYRCCVLDERPTKYGSCLRYLLCVRNASELPIQ